MSEKHDLLIDIGNSNIKMATFNAGSEVTAIQPTTVKLEAILPHLKRSTNVYMCSVACEHQELKIQSLCEQHQIPFYVLSTKAEQFGIKNSYKTFENMGNDRWAAIVAGSRISRRDYIVVDAGTALTIDLVVDKHHLGGWITAGINTSRSAIVNNTSRVFDDDDIPLQLKFGDDTPACVANGALAQAIGTVMIAFELGRAKSEHLEIIISGGDREKIIENLPLYLQDRIIEIPNVVLSGLACISKSRQSGVENG